MTLFSLTQNLHREDQPIARSAAVTHVGQAHFAGSGPAGRTCRQCKLWNWRAKVEGWTKFDGPRPAQCGQYKALMREWGRKVPHNALACQYFSERADEIPMLKPERVTS